MPFRDFRKDQLKSTAEIIKASKLKCEFCDEPVTKYKGPGDQMCCRKHQKNLAEYGGTGKVGTVHSHARGRSCDKCGYVPEEDPENIEIAEDVKHMNTIIRGLLEVDHIDGDHSNNDPENLQTLCPTCHRKKTLGNKDYLRKNCLKDELV